MDYTKIPRALIYRDRRSLEEFGAYEEGSITRPLAEAMLHLNFVRQVDAEVRALWCMNTACYICTMLLLEKDPRWRVSEYERISTPNWNNLSKQFQFLTLSMVVLLMEHLFESMSSLCQKAVSNIALWIANNTEDFPIYDNLKKALNSDQFISNTLPEDYFAPRIIDKETVEDVMKVHDFNWVIFVNYFEERSVRDIVNSFGKTEEEKHNIIDILRQASNGFYTTGFNDYPEKVNKMLDDIDSEIQLQYNQDTEEVLLEDETAEAEAIENSSSYDARIKELEKENAELKDKLVQQSTATNNKKNEELEKEVERFKNLYEASSKQVERYESILGTVEELSKETKFSIAERIIFCSALLGCSLGEDDINQKQMAKLITRFTGDKWNSIRTTISKINGKLTDLVEVAKRAKQEKDAGSRLAIWRKEEEKYKGLTNAALNVYKYLHAAVKGGTVNAKPHQCKQAMENIDHAYYLSERKLITSTDGQPIGDDFALPPEEF